MGRTNRPPPHHFDIGVFQIPTVVQTAGGEGLDEDLPQLVVVRFDPERAVGQDRTQQIPGGVHHAEDAPA